MNGSILIIDDDEDILKTLSALLSDRGYATDTAKTGAEAIEKAGAKFFNLILIDIVLPDMLGTQLLKKLETTPKIRKIIITGHATLNNAVEALNLGADAYIMKPINPKQLLAIIDKQLTEQEEETVMTQDKIAKFVETRAKQLAQTKRKN